MQVFGFLKRKLITTYMLAAKTQMSLVAVIVCMTNLHGANKNVIIFSRVTFFIGYTF